MKFNFWLELPVALISVFEQNASLEDVEKGKSLLNTSKAMEQIYFKIQKELDYIATSSYLSSEKTKDMVKKITMSLQIIEKESSQIILQAMKFSVRLINKFISYIELESKFSFNQNDIIILEKIKYFLSLIKASVNILNSTKVNMYSSSEEHFCSVFKQYLEKSEAKLFEISMGFLSSSVQNIQEDKKLIPQQINKVVLSKPMTPNPNSLIINSTLNSNSQLIGSLNKLFHQQNSNKNNELELKNRANSFCNNSINQPISNFSTPQINMLKIDN